MARTSNSNRSNKFRKSLTNVREYFKEYCASTSIHGFRYFGEERSIFEKIWWIVIFITCLSFCSFMIYKIWNKYQSSPVIVTFATKDTPIYKIPFPAITICPEVKSERSKFNFTDVFKKKQNNETLTITEAEYLQSLSLICDQNSELENTNETFTGNFFDIIDQLKPEKFFTCTYPGAQSKCDDLFIPVFTDEGICWSFNILDRSHIFKDLVYHYKDYHQVAKKTQYWDMQRGYFNENELDVYPLRALYSGATSGVTLLLRTPDENIDFICKDVQGFKVVLHAPIRIPRLKQDYFRIPLDQAVIAAVQPLMITTSEGVKTFDVDKRECYFTSERNLQYYQTYSQQNCALECLTNLTLFWCDCVSIFMPRENETNICGPEKQGCLKDAEEMMQMAELSKKFDKLDSLKNFFDTCDCLPLCTDLSYNVEISQTNWDWKKSLEQLPQLENFDGNKEHLSSLTIYFRVNHFITSERQELYGPTDFVANFGGLLGLFTGFSMLSLMEIIYFLTIRICCNIKLYRRWSGTEVMD